MQKLQKATLIWIAIAVTALVAVFSWYAASALNKMDESTSGSEVVPVVTYKNGEFYWLTFHVRENNNEVVVENITKFINNQYSVSVNAKASTIEMLISLKNSNTLVKNIGIDSTSTLGFWELWFMFESNPSNAITLFYSHKTLNGQNLSGSVLEDLSTS